MAIALSVYNYKRFGNPLEFGVRYQLAGVYPRKLMDEGKFSSWRYVIPTPNGICLPKPAIISDFPHVVAERTTERFAQENGPAKGIWSANRSWGSCGRRRCSSLPFCRRRLPRSRCSGVVVRRVKSG